MYPPLGSYRTWEGGEVSSEELGMLFLKERVIGRAAYALSESCISQSSALLWWIEPPGLGQWSTDWTSDLLVPLVRHLCDEWHAPWFMKWP
jgi:hypothetical protein